MFTNNTTSINELLETSRDFDQHKVDYNAKANRVTFFANDDKPYISIPDNDLGAFAQFIEQVETPFDEITDHAHYQLCQKLPYASNRMLPADFMKYLMSNQADNWAMVMNRHAMGNDKNLFIRTYGDSIRAVLSDRYSPVQNTSLLETLQSVIDNISADVSFVRGTYLTPDKMGIKAKFFDRPTDLDGDYMVGVFIGNDEIGSGKIRIAPMIQRHRCENSIIVDAMDENAVVMRHVGSNIANQVVSTSVIARCLQVADSVVDKMIEGYHQPVNELEKVLQGMAKKYNLTQKAETNLAIGSAFGDSIPNTKTGIINALTYTAHASDLDPETQADLEIEAGQLLWLDHRQFEKRMQVFVNA